MRKTHSSSNNFLNNTLVYGERDTSRKGLLALALTRWTVAA